MLPINVKLRVSSPDLQVKRNPRAARQPGADRRHYMIGSSTAAVLQCDAEGIEPQHCVVDVGPRDVTVRDLGSASGVFVNGERITGERRLHDTDRIRVGALELVVEIDDPAQIDEVYQEPSAEQEAQQISDWLLRQDESEWRLRMQQPELRRFALPGGVKSESDSPVEENVAPLSESSPAPATQPRPTRRAATPPAAASPDTESAAAGALRKLGIRTHDVLRGSKHASEN